LWFYQPKREENTVTTQKPVFGKKTSAQTRRAAPRPAASQALSEKAEAFLQREREAAGEKIHDADGASSSSANSGVSGGKPVWGRRVFARIFDELLVWGLLFLMFHEDIGRQLSVYIEAPMGSAQEDAAGVGLIGYALIWALIECAYNIAMEASRLQATLGKLLVGAVVTDRDGGKPSLRAVVMRNSLGRFAVNLIPFNAGYLMGLFKKDRRCVHDMIAGTMVRKRVPVAASAGYSEVFA